MSTAIGHGLVDPKRRGKPVTNTNKDGAPMIEVQISFIGHKGMRQHRLERESGQYSGTRVWTE